MKRLCAIFLITTLFLQGCSAIPTGRFSVGLNPQSNSSPTDISNKMTPTVYWSAPLGGDEKVAKYQDDSALHADSAKGLDVGDVLLILGIVGLVAVVINATKKKSTPAPCPAGQFCN